MQIVSIGDNLHEMLNPVSWEKIRKISQKLSAENFTQSAVLTSESHIQKSVFGTSVNSEALISLCIHWPGYSWSITILLQQ